MIRMHIYTEEKAESWMHSDKRKKKQKKTKKNTKMQKKKKKKTKPTKLSPTSESDTSQGVGVCQVVGSLQNTTQHG